MKFFIPHAKDDNERDSVYRSIVEFAKQTSFGNISNRKIYSIDYLHEGKKYFAKVGEIENRTGEEVIAILDSVTYLVCTPNRGVVRGGPILVGKNEITNLEFFE